MFSFSSREISLSPPATLTAHCRARDADDYRPSQLNLNACLGNNNGKFCYKGVGGLASNFSASATNIRLTGTRLYATLRTVDAAHPTKDAVVNLDEFITNSNGSLQFCPLSFATQAPIVPRGRVHCDKKCSVPIRFLAPPFIHNHFRLLELQPGAEGSPLIAVIRQYKTVEDAGHYEAMSYCWGDDREMTVVEGNEAGEYLRSHLTRNATCALIQLRLPDKKRRLWIDQVCIKQDDLEERALQVADMHRIYRRADRVIAWLGHDDVVARNIFVSLQAERPQDVSQVALNAFMRRAWFHRTWVVQEIMIGHEIQLHCGPYHVKWESFSSLVEKLDSHEKELPTWFQGIKPIPPASLKRASYVGLRLAMEACGERDGRAGHLAKRMPWSKLPTVLSATRQYRCSITHDKLYGILSLFHPPIPIELRPDYSKTETEVFRDLASFLLKQDYFVQSAEQILNVGLATGHESNLHDHLPAWMEAVTSMSLAERRAERVVDFVAQRLLVGVYSGWLAELRTDQLYIAFKHGDEDTAVYDRQREPGMASMMQWLEWTEALKELAVPAYQPITEEECVFDAADGSFAEPEEEGDAVDGEWYRMIFGWEDDGEGGYKLGEGIPVYGPPQNIHAPSERPLPTHTPKQQPPSG